MSTQTKQYAITANTQWESTYEDKRTIFGAHGYVAASGRA
jgi:hypothetical protein